jgi:hypothetical protein
MAETILAALIRSAQLADTHLSGSSAEAREAQKEATSFRWSLAVWFIYLWRGDEQSLYGLALDEEEKRRLWRRLLGSLLQGDPM